MALSGKSTGNGNAPYYVNSGVIKAAELQYAVPNENDPNKVSDVVLKLVLECTKNDGTTYEKKIDVPGNYKTDEATGTFIGWGSAFKVKDVFNTFKLNDWETDDNGIFPVNLCPSIVGKTLWFIKYRTSNVDEEGKRVYYTFKLFGDNAEYAERRFLKDANNENERFRPYLYDPDGTDDGTKFEYGANVPSAADEDIF